MSEKIVCYLLHSQGNKLLKVRRNLTINHFEDVKKNVNLRLCNDSHFVSPIAFIYSHIT